MRCRIARTQLSPTARQLFGPVQATPISCEFLFLLGVDTRVQAPIIPAKVFADTLGNDIETSRAVALLATRTALEHGQVDELLLDPAEGPDEATRAELVRLASLTAASVLVVEGHDGLRRLDGVGALLRYRHD